MSITRGDLVTLTQNLADAVGSARWTPAQIQQLLGLAQWRRIAELLNANNQYYINNPQPTQSNINQDGQFLVSDLTTGTGDNKLNFYRILTVAQPFTSTSTAQIYYRKANFTRYPNPQPTTSLPYVWYRYGNVIQILPAVNGQQMSVVVNYRPARVDQLSGDGVTITYPDGYETGLAYDAAAMMLDKGAAESGAAQVLRENGDNIASDMMLDLGRMSTDPIIALATDSPEDWGGGFY